MCCIMGDTPRTSEQSLNYWGNAVLPPTVELIHTCGAALKRGGTALQVATSRYTRHAERAGCPIDPTVNRADATRSCE